uniref:Reverse transcriptase Ty1/copia-type domain-containing protein n=1 Tax=Lactuca sativa TaxID=4236 RepID=A0A9R1W0B0_LACSA|nr:hypothetical protein LSAT_V11C400217110 [Lactuca sativa]
MNQKVKRIVQELGKAKSNVVSLKDEHSQEQSELNAARKKVKDCDSQISSILKGCKEELRKWFLLMLYELQNKTMWLKEEIKLSLKLNHSIIAKRYGKATFEVLKGRKPYISYFHVFRYLGYILNQMDQLSIFKAKYDDVLQLKKKIIEESMNGHVENHPSSIINEIIQTTVSSELASKTSMIIPLTSNAIENEAETKPFEIPRSSNVEVPLDEVPKIEVLDSKVPIIELNEFKKHNVWTLIPRPKCKNITRAHWVYHNKMDANGLRIRNKARLVSQGFTQLEGLDYDDSYPIIFVCF